MTGPLTAGFCQEYSFIKRADSKLRVDSFAREIDLLETCLP